MTIILDEYEDEDWTDLPIWVREAASVLGYNAEVWDDDGSGPPSSEDRSWRRLTIAERRAATRLGYTAETWDDDESSNSSSSSSSDEDEEDKAEEGSKDRQQAMEGKNEPRLPNLLCVQIYTETPDYLLRMRNDMGVSMYVNRDTTADDILFRSPVGPVCEPTTLLQPSSSSTLSPARQAFADRFLEWQSTYHGGGTTDSEEFVGASEADRPLFSLTDFARPSPPPGDDDDDDEYYLPSPDNPSYFLHLFEHDYAIVEFLPPPDNHHNQDDNTTNIPPPLPPSRRFEILPFDESICWDGEKDYDPVTHRRPPTLCAHRSRSLELPGHFTNHACGSSATVYDTFRLAGEGEGPSPLVTPAQPQGVREQLGKYVATGKFPEEFPNNTMTIHRAMARGEEVTTDYALWHWCNEDYIEDGPSMRTPSKYWDKWEWKKLPGRVMIAAQLLGYDRDMWDRDRKRNPPLCGKDWGELTGEQQSSAKILGFSKRTWNDDGSGDGSNDVTEETDKKERQNANELLNWSKLTPASRSAANLLGYDAALWNSNREPRLTSRGWHHLTPAQLTAASVLGYDRCSWNGDSFGAEEPWFDCLCGDEKCHSASGFRGVRYFEGKEQGRLYWVCSEWIRNQIDWKRYQLEQEGGTGVEE